MNPLKEEIASVSGPEVVIGKSRLLSLIAAALEAAQGDITGLAIKIREQKQLVLREMTRADKAEAALKEAREAFLPFVDLTVQSEAAAVLFSQSKSETAPCAVRVLKCQFRDARALLSKQDSGTPAA